jgi:alpha-tubulin suppressor-like RCC1 family protein
MGASQKDHYAVSAISGGKDQTLVLLQSGELLGWGGAGCGRVTSLYVDICRNSRISSVNSEVNPVYITEPSRYSSVSAGYGLSLGVSDQKLAFIWGFCQISVGGRDTYSEKPHLIDGISDVSKVAAGQFLFAAIDQSGSVYSWGLNIDGSLGRTVSQTNAPPAVIAGIPPMRDIVIGDNCMLCVTRDGKLYVWGNNSAGQLGVSHLNAIFHPQPVVLSSPISSIAMGSTHVLAVTSDGKVYGWGSNHLGQLGVAKHLYVASPKLIAFPEKISAVAAGMHYSLALTASGKVYAWGWNGFGQLGLNDLQSRSVPTLIPSLSGVRAIAAGEMHALAIGHEHLFGWGNNNSMQIGKAAERQLSPNPFLAIA